MRESIGAAWIFSLVLIFILMFTGFVAVSVNYARAFQLKNVIVNYIEENEGVPTIDNSLETAIANYVVHNGYTAHDVIPDMIEDDDPDGRQMSWRRVMCIQNTNQVLAANDCTVAIYKACNEDLTNNSDYDFLNDKMYKNVFKFDNDSAPSVRRDYYKVITFFDFDLPLFRHILTFRVNGETQVIYDFAECNGSGCGIQ